MSFLKHTSFGSQEWTCRPVMPREATFGAVANQTIGSLQDEILDLMLPLQILTEDFRKTFHAPHFQIRGATAVEQMQNLVAGILDLPRGEQQHLFVNLEGHKGKDHEDRDGHEGDR